MSYTKPGVEITQLQISSTPVLATPEWDGVIIGRGYYWQDPLDDDNSVLDDVVYSGIAAAFSLSELSDIYDVTGDESLVVVDLVESADVIHHLEYTTDFSVNSNTVTISGGITANPAYIRVGFRAANAAALGFLEMASAGDIESIIGKSVSWNPLAYGASLAQGQFGSKIYTYGISDDSISAYNEALAALENQKVYAMAPMSHRVLPTTMVAHCNAMSEPEVKKERIVFVNKPIPSWAGTAHAETSAQRAITAAAIRDAYIDVQEKRLFIPFPDFMFVEESRHISTIHPTWIKNSFTEFTTITDNSYFKARFAADIDVSGTKYKMGQEITTAIWATLVTAGYHELTVLAPVPGFYTCAAAAGQVVGKDPEQPLTNVPVVGFARTYGAQDYFSEAHLNVIAAGGYYIMTQRAIASTVVCRHQMSTNMLSIAKRELSITNVVDYTSYFIRDVIEPYIGRFNITPNFLKKVRTMLTGIGDTLVADGRITSLSVDKLEQSSVSPDTVLCELTLGVKYPVNKIRITLMF